MCLGRIQFLQNSVSSVWMDVNVCVGVCVCVCLCVCVSVCFGMHACMHVFVSILEMLACVDHDQFIV